jgi:NhaA family Na+:H+ antiporter
VKKIIGQGKKTVFVVSQSFRKFSRSQQFSGVLLIACTLSSLFLANSGFSYTWTEIRHLHIGKASAEFIVNDVLMSFFFLLAGLEIKREFLAGELAGLSRAALPVSAALGGMIVPALIFSLVTHNTIHSNSWGIPMATDIAFSLGILSLLGNRIPAALKVFLVALAVADDLGAIVVIGLFYTSGFDALWFFTGMLSILGMYVLNHKKIEHLPVYFLAGACLWYCLLKSGVHPTLAGVITAFMIPFSKEEGKSPLHSLEQALHSPVNFIIMPLFALWNTAITIEAESTALFTEALPSGIIFGLVLGKPLGIFLFCWLSVKLKMGRWPYACKPIHIAGVGVLGGIGFTMSIFITLLSVSEPSDVKAAKLAILLASLISALIGLLILFLAGRKEEKIELAS